MRVVNSPECVWRIPTLSDLQQNAVVNGLEIVALAQNQR